MANQRRTHRVAEKIREIVASLILKSADERLTLVTITAVTVSKDLRVAKIYWNVTDGKTRRADTEKAFEKAASYFRRELAKVIEMRVIPELRFYYDTTLDTMEEVDRLIEKARA